ncbi:hypothetical protein TNCV_626681 [Trichonephila clavipes]|nr:hypothetical protein TNCV_626681 [Trichonephila clavipes]
MTKEIPLGTRLNSSNSSTPLGCSTLNVIPPNGQSVRRKWSSKFMLSFCTWNQHFKEDREIVEDDKRSKPPQTSRIAGSIEKVSEAELMSKLQIIKQISKLVGICDYYRLGCIPRRLRESIRKKRPKLWAEQSWVLLPDKVPIHQSLPVTILRKRKQLDRLIFLTPLILLPATSSYFLK